MRCDVPAAFALPAAGPVRERGAVVTVRRVLAAAAGWLLVVPFAVGWAGVFFCCFVALMVFVVVFVVVGLGLVRACFFVCAWVPRPSGAVLAARPDALLVLATLAAAAGAVFVPCGFVSATSVDDSESLTASTEPEADVLGPWLASWCWRRRSVAGERGENMNANGDVRPDCEFLSGNVCANRR